HPDDAEGGPRARDQWPLPPGSPPDLLGHSGRRCRHGGGAELALADGRRPGRDLLHLQRDRRGALHCRAVPRLLPGVQALNKDAPAVHLLSGTVQGAPSGPPPHVLCHAHAPHAAAGTETAAVTTVVWQYATCEKSHTDVRDRVGSHPPIGGCPSTDPTL